jgi:hypothetical protein
VSKLGSLLWPSSINSLGGLGSERSQAKILVSQDSHPLSLFMPFYFSALHLCILLIRQALRRVPLRSRDVQLSLVCICSHGIKSLVDCIGSPFLKLNLPYFLGMAVVCCIFVFGSPSSFEIQALKLSSTNFSSQVKMRDNTSLRAQPLRITIPSGRQDLITRNLPNKCSTQKIPPG